MTSILIVNDNTPDLGYLEALLTDHGLEVGSAREGRETLQKARENPSALLVTELAMPIMNGHDLLRLWLADEKLRGTPLIVYIATSADPRDGQPGFDLGATEVLIKGTEPQMFVELSSNIFARAFQLDTTLAPSTIEREEAGERYREAIVRNQLEKRNKQLMEANRLLHAKVVERTESADRLIALFDALPAHIALIDHEGIILSVNESWQRFAAGSSLKAASSTVGQNYLLRCEVETGDCSEGSHDAAAGIRKVLSGELPRFSIEYPCRSSMEQLWFRVIASPLRGAHASGAVIVRNDITERKKIELELHESREHSLLLLNSAAEGIFGLGTDGVCTFANPAAATLLGYQQPSEMVGEHFHSRHHYRYPDGTRYPSSECAIQRAFLHGDKSHVSQEVFFRRDGKQFPVEYWSHPIRNSTDIVGSVVTFIDISERRSLEAQLAHARKMEAIGQLSGGIAHDFNNLLTVVLGCTELLLGEMNEDHAQRNLAEMIRTAAQRGAELTHRMLAFGSRQMLKPRAINVSKILRDIKAMLGRTFPADIVISIIEEPNLWKAMADPAEAESAVLNVVLNARDAMPKGGLLTMELANVCVDKDYANSHIEISPGSYVLLSISDTGIGIPPDQLERVFEPFYTTKEVGKGTGLGLSMVYGFVKQSGGHVQVYSEPGLGTTVRLYLPSAGVMKEDFAEVPVTNPDVRGSDQILIAEDDSVATGFAAERLKSLVYSTTVSTNGKESLEAIRNNSDIDLLFTDVVMPGGMNSTELADPAGKN